MEILLRRKFWIIFAVILACVSGYMVSSLGDPIYSASARVIVQQRDTVFDAQGAVNAARTIQTELRLVESFAVKQEVLKTLKRLPRSISASEVPNTDLINISATGLSPEGAAKDANAWAKAYVTVRRAQSSEGLLDSIEQVKIKVSETQKQIDALDRQISATGNSLSQVGLLNAQRAKLVEIQSAFSSKAAQLEVDASISAGGVQVVTPAEPSLAPIAPKPSRSAVLAGILGGLLASGLILLREMLDKSVRSPDEATAALGQPVLGLIPRIAEWKNETDTFLKVRDEPNSPAAESFRTLRTAVQFLGGDEGCRRILVTSANASEGKSSVASNLAYAFAQSGKSTIVVDCDLRRSRTYSYLLPKGAERPKTGLAEAIRSPSNALSAIIRVDKNLDLLPAGPVPANPAELLGASATKRLMDWLKRYEVVIFDCPPILPVTDAAVVAKYADSVLLVCDVGNTDRRDFARAGELMRQVSAPIIGSVLNGVRAEKGYNYGYSYVYKQYVPDEKKGGLLARFRKSKAGTRGIKDESNESE